MNRLKKLSVKQESKRILAAAMACFVTVSMMPANVVRAADEKVTIESTVAAVDGKISLESTETTTLTAKGYQGSTESAFTAETGTWTTTEEGDDVVTISTPDAETTIITAKDDIEGEAEITAKGKVENVAVEAKTTIQVAAPVNKVEFIDDKDAAITKVDLEEVGSTAAIKAVCKDSSDAAINYAKVTWTSTDDTVATVAGGTITAVKAGTTKVTATALNGTKAEIPVNVTTTAVENPVKTFKITEPEPASVEIDKTLKLETVVTPEGAAPTITWKADESGNASVADGVVTGVKEGKATITATISAAQTEGKADLTESVEITVTKPDVAVTGVTFKNNVTEKTLSVGKGFTLKAVVAPENATNKAVTWKSDKENIATVQDGVVTAVADGTAKITATSVANDKMSATCTVTVKKAATGITITDPASPTLEKGDKVTLAAKVEPEDATQDVEWSTSNEEIATVTDGGEVEALKTGEVTITAKVPGTDLSDTVNLTIVQYITGIEIKGSKNVAPDKSIQLKAEVLPEDATSKEVSWKLKAPVEGIAIDANGLLTVTKAVTANTKAIVIATAKDKGAVASNEYTVTVTDIAKKVIAEAADKNTEIAVRDTLQYSAKAYSDAEGKNEITDSSFTWKSSDENVATVDEKGLVTGIKAGSTTITAIAADGSEVKSEAIALKVNSVEATKIALGSGEEAVALEGSTPKDITVTFTPTNTTDMGLDVSVKGSAVEAKVGEPNYTDGTVKVTLTGKEVTKKDTPEEVTITSSSNDKLTLTSKVTVTEPAISEVKLTCEGDGEEKDAYYVNHKYQLKAAITPDTVLNKAITYTVKKADPAAKAEEPAPAVVDENGMLTILEAGKITITATSKLDPTKSAELTIDAAKKDVKSISCDPSITAKLGETVKLNVTVNPSDASYPEVTFASDNEGIASVDASGNVTIKGIGNANITVTSTDNNKLTAVCAVTGEKIAVSALTLSETAKTIKVGEGFQLSASVTPDSATNKNVTWSSDNAAATVDAQGNVKAAAAGTARITASADGVTAVCTVNVVPSVVDPSSITLSASNLTILKGQSATVTAAVAPADATNKTVTWTTSDGAVASVANGVITAVAKGTATITAATANGKTAVCTVVVPEVKLNASASVLQIKKSSSAVKVVSKYPANDQVASYASSNAGIVKVDKKGKITAGKKTGKATITVTMASGASASYKVTVQKGKVVTKSLSLSAKKLTILKGKKATLEVVRNPISATEKITYTTSNKKVVTVDKKGKLKAAGAGTATITAKTSNGKKAVCKVTVPGVTLKAASASVKVNKTTAIKVKSTVVKGDKVKSYKSSNTKVASVSSKGVVKGLKKGKATITLTMKSGATAQFKVTVK